VSSGDDIPSSTNPKFIGGTILAIISRRRALAIVKMGEEQDVERDPVLNERTAGGGGQLPKSEIAAGYRPKVER